MALPEAPDSGASKPEKIHLGMNGATLTITPFDQLTAAERLKVFRGNQLFEQGKSMLRRVLEERAH